MQKILAVTIACMIFGIATNVLSGYRTTEKKNRTSDLKQWVTPPLPDSMRFGGETVPLYRTDIQEQLERELLYTYYLPNQIIYVIKLSQRYFPLIEQRLKANGVPDDKLHENASPFNKNYKSNFSFMKKISLISVWIIICCACNSNSSGGGNAVMNDSSANSKATYAPPGLGSDPTRNDATKVNPVAGDSFIPQSRAGATPGVGNDPTRNDASKRDLAPNSNAYPTTDTVLKKN